MRFLYRPLSHGGHFESQENRKLCFYPSSLALDERLDGQNLFVSALYDKGLSWLNWNLEMLVFVEGGKPENLETETRSKSRTSKKLNSFLTPGRYRTRVTLPGGELALSSF